jgi:hypothetical protein
VAEFRHDQNWLQINAIGEHAYRSGGEHAMWAAMLEADKQIHSGTSGRPFSMAQEEFVLGHTDEAFAVLDGLVAEHNPAVMGLINDPILRPIRQDPRFKRISEKIGLSPRPANSPK